MYDLVISGNNCELNCKCSRWDTQNYSIIIETWMNKSDLKNLRDSITPGAVGELYKILGKPLYYDKTWTSANTLQITPASNRKLRKMRGKNKLIFVKNITDSPIDGPSEWLNVKIEGMISGSGDL